MRGGIRRKPEAKSRTDGQELYIRLTWNGRVCHTKQSPILHEFHTVNTAVTWEEVIALTRGGLTGVMMNNNHVSDNVMNCEKSAEAIVANEKD